MGPDQNRRSFVKAGVAGLAGAAAAAGSAGASPLHTGEGSGAAPAPPNPIYRISLAQWAINMSFKQKGGTRDNLEFARIARQNGYDAVEYVNQFFMDKATDTAYLAEMKRIADGEGIRNVLIMIDGEGRIGDPDRPARDKAVQGHFKWIDAAAALGCHAVRLNAFGGPGSWIEQLGYTGDGYSRVVDYGARNDINVIIENHGGLSSDPYWLVDLMHAVGRGRAGVLPDFGNFRRGEGNPAEYVDPYEAVRMLMPYQKGLSVKEFAMHPDGERRRVNFERMMRLALDRGFRGYAGVEYGGIERIREAREELEQVRAKLTALYS
ncbi:MAG: sugar phosphate isomerase/epimerase [Gemmatimonadetes bacterium]|nr:sugar phosphate isomerase/epimerase [Gemmatimonadota bacterium]